MFEKHIKNKFLREAAEWFVTIAVAVFIFFALRAFLFVNAEVSGDSMAPTLAHGDKVIVNKIGYLLSAPKYGDIVVFPYKERPDELYIKRIIGLPGDEIDLKDFGFYVNGNPLEDDFSYNLISDLGNITYPVTVPEKCYFVLGDNRNSSKDSRYAEVGFISKKDFTGTLAIRFWPLDKIGTVN